MAGELRPARANGVPGVYSVLLEPGVARRPDNANSQLPAVAEVARSLQSAHGGKVEEVWEHIGAYVVRMPAARAQMLAADPRVRAVTQDSSVSAPAAPCTDRANAWAYTFTPVQSPQTLSCSDPDPANDTGSPTADPACKDNWGLDRIDAIRDDLQYAFTPAQTPPAVHVYVLDTGIHKDHQEFALNQVTGGIDARYNPVRPAATGGDTSDCNGHGTHVAGIIGGHRFGVAKNVKIHPVRVLSCGQATTSTRRNFKRALNWIIANAERPAVVNWSGGNSEEYVSTPRDSNGNVIVDEDLVTAVQNLITAGITLVQSAGNHEGTYDSATGLRRDACDWSFGKIPGVIVVGGADFNDGRWTRRSGVPGDQGCGTYDGDPYYECGSLGGACIDIWAPAAHVLSASIGPVPASEDDETPINFACQLSGTSMAAPFVTGAIALYLQSHDQATPTQVESALRASGSWGVFQSGESSGNFIGHGSDNVFLSAPILSTGSPAPVAAFTVSCPGHQCTFTATTSSAIAEYTWRFSDGGAPLHGPSVTRTFPLNSTNAVTLGVKDSGSPARTDHLRQIFKVETDDAPPVASFTASCIGRHCTFTSASTDAGGSIAGLAWSFGDSTPNGSGTPVQHTYASYGTFNVTLTVTDNAGQIDTTTHSVTTKSVRGDFNADAKTDLIWRNHVTGLSTIWLLNGTAYAGESSLGIVPGSWSIVATEDFNGDHQSDLVWRNESTFATMVWFMNGVTYAGEASLPTMNGAEWRIAGAGDFNGDGKGDLVWQNSTTFQTIVRLLDGTTLINDVGLPTVNSADWSIRGAGDFNGDGKPDLVWRNSSTFATVVWLMNGTSYAGEGTLPSVSSSAWNVDAVGDYNGDGKSDLVWRNATTFQTVVWLLDGVVYLGEATLPVVSNADWKVVAPR